MRGPTVYCLEAADDGTHVARMSLPRDAKMHAVLHAALDYVVARGVLGTQQREEVERTLLDREREVSMAIGNALAVPHAYHDALREPVIVFIRLAHAINLGAPDGVPTRLVFVLLGPTTAAVQHVATLATIARLMSDDEFRYDAGTARTQLDLLAARERFVKRTAKPAERKPSVEAVYPRGLFAGLAADVRRCQSHYLSDFSGGFHSKCLAPTLFLFYACLAPAVTCGGIMGELTGGQIGAFEMLVASAVCGVAYAVLVAIKQRQNSVSSSSCALW